jgi:tRNA pseudouridine38-40 synthase
VQARGPTIQGELELALAQATQRKVRVIASGRTDAGVHALGQVIAFAVPWRHPLEELQRALNALLPEDIVVRELSLAEANWHPRFSARSREYLYRVLNQPLRSPLLARYTCHVNVPLAVEAMGEASQRLIGVHDFAAFGHAPQGDNTVREVYRATWQAQDAELHFEIEANAFLTGMVRSLVGTLLLVGSGRLGVEDFVEILRSRDRSRAGSPAPPQGLYLVRVNY